MPAYGEATYWDQRYQREPTSFDWYQSYAGLEPILKRHIKQQHKILHVGVGTSLLQAEMVELGGYTQIVNTDISSVAIKHMQELHKSLPQLKYRIGDVRSMPEFKDASFDIILDKGTLDATLCGKSAGLNATSMLDECNRVLRPGGALVIVTYGEPCSRLPLLLQQCLDWRVTMYVLGKHADAGLIFGPQLTPIIQGPIDAHTLVSPEPFTCVSNAHYVYVCYKQSSSASSSAAED